MTEQQVADRINAMTPGRLKTYENRLRRMARRQGLVVHKSRTRDPRALTYNGFMVADENSNTVVAGGIPHGYSMQIDDVEKFLKEERRIHDIK